MSGGAGLVNSRGQQRDQESVQPGPPTQTHKHKHRSANTVACKLTPTGTELPESSRRGGESWRLLTAEAPVSIYQKGKKTPTAHMYVRTYTSKPALHTSPCGRSQMFSCINVP